MISSARSITLTNHEIPAIADACGGELSKGLGDVRPDAAMGVLSRPFLRIPSFPGARVSTFVERRCRQPDLHRVADELRRWRVGGCYWGAQPPLPANRVLVRSRVALDQAAGLAAANRIVLWEPAPSGPPKVGVYCISGDCDAWHMLSGAAALVTEADDELRIIAALLGVPCYLFDPHQIGLQKDTSDAAALLGTALAEYDNPFTGEAMGVQETIELCGFWRRLIDSNRDLQGGVGFAFWKQGHVAPLLWDGSAPFQFFRDAREVPAEGSIAIWRAKTSTSLLAQLEARDTPLIEVEDGFLRSRGLGADCIPPLSITVDRSGAYFDPSQPSDLENLLEYGEFGDGQLARARELRHLIVERGIGKYESGVASLDRPAGTRRHILVPGQVEDDRAVIAGGCGLVRNLDLLASVRDQVPDSFILYKPHPDVVAGHRRGSIAEAECLRFADKIVTEASIASLVDMVDEVHVNTSLAGFEALLRGKPVTTYGVPFYAGWGLTADLGPVPARRTAKRTTDELVAAALLRYPRYIDPVTGLPCPAEVVVERLGAADGSDLGLIVGLRRLQGKLMRRLRSLVQ